MYKTKTITVRLSYNDYNKILAFAKNAHRSISNFITHSVLKRIDESSFVDSIETAQILEDAELQKRLKSGHADRKKMKGKFVE